MTTILHISDLHRDSDGELTTRTLLESLRLDRERQRSEGIPAVDIVIVSGDVVLGVKDQTSEGVAELTRQYKEADEFLGHLADMMLSGNRNRVVIVPGNHDVSHSHVLRATSPEAIPDAPHLRQLLAQKLAKTGSLHRWVASEFSVRLIVDEDMYAQRMTPFAEFYSEFYRGARNYSLEAAQQCEVFDYPDLGVVIAGLSSCCENDIFNKAGRIHPDSVASATTQVSALIKQGRVAVAVWHHNLSGGPKDSDYVDPEFLQTMMDGGFVLGLHGHQHRPQFIEHRFTADGKLGMAVISAGTLCGGPRTLPAGRMRAYNLITLNLETGISQLHVREMKNSSFCSPVWGAAHVHEFNGSSMEFKFIPPAIQRSSLERASEAASFLRAGDPVQAFEHARRMPDDEFARIVAVEALNQIEDWNALRQFCSPPRSATETILLMSALYELGEKSELRKLIHSDLVTNSMDVATRQIVEQMIARIGR